jgi:hypothetical protein
MNDWGASPPLADQGPAFPLVGIWQRWDACWYSKVAAYGYDAASDSVNFWPVTPMAMRLVAWPLGGNVALAGLIVAGVAYVIAITGLFRLVRRDFDEPLAHRTVLFISIAPAAFFLFAPFTEAPFLAATVWAILAARERSWGIAVLAAAFAALTRIQGVFLVLPLAWEAWCAWRERLAVTAPTAPAAPAALAVPAAAATPADVHAPRATRSSPLHGSLRRLPPPTSVVAVLAPIAAFGTWLLITDAIAGRTPLQTQAIWGGNSFHWPWEVVDAALSWTIDKHDGLQALNLAVLMLFLVTVIAGLRVVPLSYSLLALPQVLLIAIRIQPTPLTSTTRLVEVIFPAFVMFAIWMDGRRRELTWVIVSTLLLGALVWTYVKGDWVA